MVQNIPNHQDKNSLWLIYALAIVKFVFPYLIQSPIYEPHRDEFLYLAEAHHLAFGYLEVPPMMSYLGYLSNLMGAGMFWIKFWPSLFGALTYIIVGWQILLFGGRWFALVLGFLPFVFGYYVHTHFMFQPNFLEVFFWTSMAYGIIYNLKTGENKGLYIAGIAFGLGMMSKYSVAFFAAGILAGLLLTPERKIFLNKHLYYALFTGMVLFMPNIIWQWAYGFPLLHQMKELQSQQLQFVNQATFLLQQLIYNLPCIITWITGLCWLAFSPQGKSYRFIAIAVVIAMIIIVIGHGKGYYGMGAYPVLFAFGAVYLEQWTAGRYHYLRYAMVVFTMVIGSYLDTVMLPFLPPKQLADYYARNSIFGKLNFLQWEDQKDHPLPQDFADMLSWKEMTVKTAQVYKGLTEPEKKNSIVDCDNYGESAAIDFYGRPYAFTSFMGHNASYLFWTPTDFYKKDVFIMVTDYRAIVHDDFLKKFQYAAVKDSITNPLAREFGSYILLLKNPSLQNRKEWKDYYDSLKQNTSSFHK